MSAVAISCIVFACVFGGALFGMFLRVFSEDRKGFFAPLLGLQLAGEQMDL